MNVFRQLASLNLSALWALTRLCLQKPWWVFPTLRATRECVAMCNLHYGTQHHRNTPANAFRHALWNYYIARACSRGRAKTEKVLWWTEQITNWHEDFSKNPPLARQMDLHNNRIGRVLFETKSDWEPEQIIEQLKTKTETSLKVSSLEELDGIEQDRFVHLTD